MVFAPTRSRGTGRKEGRTISSKNHRGSSNSNKQTQPDYRSAVTGRFVKEQYAKTHPDTTVKERNKK